MRRAVREIVCLATVVRTGLRIDPIGSLKTQDMRDQNYLELVKKVTMYLDNELSEKDERELLRDIKANPAYLRVLSQEKSFREFIKSKIHRRKPSQALIQSIKEKIRVAPA